LPQSDHHVHLRGAVLPGYDLTPVVEPFKVRSDQSGFERVTTVLDSLLTSGEYDRVVLGHEPTGIA
jgi:hypothetical protein